MVPLKLRTVEGRTLTNAEVDNNFVALRDAMVEATADNEFTGYNQFTSTDAIKIPAGATDQRPVAPLPGTIRFNTTTGQYEGFNGGAWGDLGGSGGGGGDSMWGVRDVIVEAEIPGTTILSYERLSITSLVGGIGSPTTLQELADFSFGLTPGSYMVRVVLDEEGRRIFGVETDFATVQDLVNKMNADSGGEFTVTLEMARYWDYDIDDWSTDLKPQIVIRGATASNTEWIIENGGENAADLYYFRTHARSKSPLVEYNGDFYGCVGGDDFNHTNFQAGEAFKLTSAGVYTSLHAYAYTDTEFKASAYDLASDGAGNFYGVQDAGHDPIAYFGEIYKITDGISSILYTFSNTSGDGFYPCSGLTSDGSGNFLGLTSDGGEFGGGTIYRITPDGVLSTIHSFTHDGNYPRLLGRLTADGLGNFYGLWIPDYEVGPNQMYKISAGGVFSLVAVVNGWDGTLCPDGSGNLLGVTTFGGALGGGTLFRITPSGVLTTIHDFDPVEEGVPKGALTPDGSGNYFGVTDSGGYGQGVIFKLSSSGDVEIRHKFGTTPNEGLTAYNGGYYGTTQTGGMYGDGWVYRFVDGEIIPSPFEQSEVLGVSETEYEESEERVEGLPAVPAVITKALIPLPAQTALATRVQISKQTFIDSNPAPEQVEEVLFWISTITSEAPPV